MEGASFHLHNDTMEEGVREMTRKEYMDASRAEGWGAGFSAAFRAYYGQFVTESCKQAVLQEFGLELLKTATDPYLNDLPLARWDSLAGGSGRGGSGDSRVYVVPWWVPLAKLREAGDGCSLSAGVCILKVAAIELREANRA